MSLLLNIPCFIVAFMIMAKILGNRTKMNFINISFFLFFAISIDICWNVLYNMCKRGEIGADIYSVVGYINLLFLAVAISTVMFSSRLGERNRRMALAVNCTVMFATVALGAMVKNAPWLHVGNFVVGALWGETAGFRALFNIVFVFQAAFTIAGICHVAGRRY